jgi:hypothetical protein
VAQAGQLLLDQAAAPQSPRSSGTGTSTSIWLFPGGQPGRHTVTLHRRLAMHGLPHAAHGRAAALIHLAADLPAPVLVDLLGISIDTANQWAKHASSDWAAYLATRNDHDHCQRYRRACCGYTVPLLTLAGVTIRPVRAPNIGSVDEASSRVASRLTRRSRRRDC